MVAHPFINLLNYFHQPRNYCNSAIVYSLDQSQKISSFYNYTQTPFASIIWPKNSTDLSISTYFLGPKYSIY